MIVADAMVIAYALVEVPERTDEVNGALEKDVTWTSPPL
jgi:predicted nucleic acid-binding protein